MKTTCIFIIVYMFCLPCFSTGSVESWRHEMNDLLDLPEDQSYVFVIAIPPKQAISYANARHMKESLLHNASLNSLAHDKRKSPQDTGGFAKSPDSVGHTLIAWQCRLPDRLSRGMTAYSGEKTGKTPEDTTYQAQQMIDKGFGLTALFAHFTDGLFFDPNNLKPDSGFSENFYRTRQGELKMKWAGFRVPHNNCEDAINFLKKFMTTPTAMKFGFNLNPRFYQGAGCSTFAKEFLRRAGVFIRTSRQWIRRLSIPTKLLGLPEVELPAKTVLNLTEKQQSLIGVGTSISPIDLLFSHWHESDPEKALTLELGDVDLIYYTLGEAERLASLRDPQLLKNFDLKPRYEVRYVDSNKEYPDEPDADETEMVHVSIDRMLDMNTQKIANSLEEQITFLGFQVKRINNIPGLIFDNVMD